MTDPRIQAAQKAINGPSGDYELGLLVAGWGEVIIPAALRLLEAVEDAMGRHQVSHIHAVLREPLAEFLALLPAVEGDE